MTREEAFNRIDAIIVKHEIDDVYVTITSFQDYDALRIARKELEQKPICPSAGIDCEDCPAYEDTISRKAVLNTLENMDRALDEDRTVENYKELLRECYKVLPKKSEWQQDHEILKAYSDGANDVLDKIRAEIDTARFVDKDTKHCRNANATGLEVALDIIDKYMAEEDKA